MDRRQLIVQRVREIFGERLDDVLHMVRQDRQDMRGWQEPAHVRAAVRRAAEHQEGAVDGEAEPAATTVTRPANRKAANSVRRWAGCSKRGLPAWKRSSAAAAN
jgi:hypothetical protein